MGYLGLDVDNLVRELILLMENNYGQIHKNNMESHFYRAKKDILTSFSETIEQNREIVFKELKEDLEE